MRVVALLVATVLLTVVMSALCRALGVTLFRPEIPLLVALHAGLSVGKHRGDVGRPSWIETTMIGLVAGYLGDLLAGAPIGLGEVELPFPISEETIAFEVAGDSMLPKYENGDVIVVYKEQRHPLASFYGEEAAVRLKTGERYLKTIERGKSPTLVNLKSFNAKPINGVILEWIGEICVTLPRGQIERLKGKAARTRKAAAKATGRGSEK